MPSVQANPENAMSASPRTEDAVLGDLTLVQSVIDEHERVVADARERRLALWAEARALTPPVTHKRLAELSGQISEVAVIRGLGRAEVKRAAAS